MAKRLTKRTTKRMTKKETKEDLVDKLNDIRRQAMEVINLAYEQGRFHDALEGLNMLKSIQHDTQVQGEWEEMIDKLIQCCRNKMN